MAQELALLALSRTDFFKKAAFLGGTALRILYGLPRFSEDLDFSLLSPEEHFDWKLYLSAIESEFIAYNLELTTTDRSEADRAIKKAFIKESSFGQQFTLRYPRSRADTQVIKIKLEIDTRPPSAAITESKLVQFPIPYSVIAYAPSTLFAGKINALLTREWVKGRDWFDLCWYVNRDQKPNTTFLKAALNQFAYPLPEGTLSLGWVVAQLEEKAESVDWPEAKKDVELLLRERDRSLLDLWSEDFFRDYIRRI